MTYIYDQYDQKVIISLSLLFGSKNTPRIFKRGLNLLLTIADHPFYKKIVIPKKRGGTRTIYEPNPTLKRIQRRILVTVLNDIPVSGSATAYRKNYSLVSNAGPHVGKRYMVKLDIHNFFNSIGIERVIACCFNDFSPAVAALLGKLCCFQGHLVQGAPTSACISNIVMKEFDETILDYCRQYDIVYTRYSDDMTFSWDNASVDQEKLIQTVKNGLDALGLKLNTRKTVRLCPDNYHRVTGLMTDQGVEVSKTAKRRIARIMYHIQKHGLSDHYNYLITHNQLSPDITLEQYRASLLGRINYVLQIEPDNSEFEAFRQLL